VILVYHLFISTTEALGCLVELIGWVSRWVKQYPTKYNTSEVESCMCVEYDAYSIFSWIFLRKSIKIVKFVHCTCTIIIECVHGTSSYWSSAEVLHSYSGL